MRPTSPFLFHVYRAVRSHENPLVSLNTLSIDMRPLELTRRKRGFLNPGLYHACNAAYLKNAVFPMLGR